MGTVFSIDARDPGDWSEAIADVVAWLHEVDSRFSTYRTDSIVSRLERGELDLDDAPEDVREVLDLCTVVERETEGAFSSYAGGRLDPSGLVKGWAIERASWILSSAGARNHGVNGGGDMRLTGEGVTGRGWRVGIADPRSPGRLLATVAGHDLAVATSGVAERGQHIIDPRTGRPVVGDLLSVTIVGADLTFVDACATAAFVMGDAACEWIEGQRGLEGLGVRADGSLWRTSGFPQPDRG